MNATTEPNLIRKPVQYDLLQYAQSRAVLRRWELIGMHAFRILVLLGLLALWMWIGDLVYLDTLKTFHVPMHPRSWRESLPRMLPYSVWLPVGIWAWYRVRQAARRTWLERVQASGIHTVEYSATGVNFWSDAATHFYRWDSFTRVVNRPSVTVLVLNRAVALLLPKSETSAEETAQVLAWSRSFSSSPSMLEQPHSPSENAVTLQTELDYRDYIEATRLEKKANAKWNYLMAWWVRLSIYATVALVFIALGAFGYIRGERGIYWYWSTFGLPVFLTLIVSWSWSFILIGRRILWHDVRKSMAQPQRLVIDDRGISVVSASSAHHYTWGAFNRMDLGKQLIMLGVIGGGPVFIPRRQIPGDPEPLIAFLRQRVMNVTQAFPVEMGSITQ